MKKIYVLALSAMMVAAFAVPSMAKVNLSGAIWVTYWAQQEGSVTGSNDMGTTWQDMNVNYNVTPNAGLGLPATPKKKTFIIGQSMSGNALQNGVVAGDGFLLALDCPVNDWVKAYGEVDVLSGVLANQLTLQQGYINLAFMKELNVRTGLMNVPFGLEGSQRPTVGQEEVFISEYSQDARGGLQLSRDAGVQLLGTLASGMVDYNVFVGNGVPSSVATAFAVNNQATPDINDAKQVGVNLCFKPFTGAFVGGSYFAGDYTLGAANTVATRARATAYDVNAGYEYGSIFSASAEYATTRHSQANVAFNLGTTPGDGSLVANRVNEYILKAIYMGVADWELGVRYGVVDPKNVEAEFAAQYAMEKKLSFGVGYKFARAAMLKAEYSWLNSSFNHLDKVDAARGALGIRQNPNQDVDDNIFALSLGLQF